VPGSSFVLVRFTDKDVAQLAQAGQ